MGPETGLRLQNFAGRWKLRREITDHRAGSVATLDGQAVFSPDAQGLRCDESGVMQVPGQPEMQASRSSLWRAEGDQIMVLFADTRPFHSFSPGQMHASATHDCPPDFYAVTYDFSRWPKWSATWQVTGPRKDYRMVSHYQR